MTRAVCGADRGVAHPAHDRPARWRLRVAGPRDAGRVRRLRAGGPYSPKWLAWPRVDHGADRAGGQRPGGLCDAVRSRGRRQAERALSASARRAESEGGVMADSRKLVKTGTPRIFRRETAGGAMGSYCVVYRAGGKQRREYAETLEAARRIKRQREADRDRGEWQERSTITLRAFLTDWIDRYQGTGRRGFRANTREEYRRLLDNFAHRYFDGRL